MILFLSMLLACQKQNNSSKNQPPLTRPTQDVQLSNLKPGLLASTPAMKNRYEGRSWDVAEGERLFTAFNCVGCHAHGGGSIGPPLKDPYWIYGGAPENIYTSIVEGRPNGMPSFRGRIADFEVWRLVAFVRSLSGQLRMDVAPSRSDHMSLGKPPNQTKKQPILGTTGRPVQK